jgi:glycosyltransferase involved in cell wall biosynthesis
MREIRMTITQGDRVFEMYRDPIPFVEDIPMPPFFKEPVLKNDTPETAVFQNDTPPIISVILTHYECTKYLPFAISSIQKQSFQNWELIIVDDASKSQEEVKKIIDSFKDHRIRFFPLPENVGTYVCKNFAIAHARGTWLAFQDSDDHSPHNRLKIQLETCLAKKWQACYGSYLCRSEPTMWKLADISLFIHIKTFQKYLGNFDGTRFGADSEIRDRLKILQIKHGVIREYLYSCLDKWMEIGYRDKSITRSTDSHINHPIRTHYKRAYLTFHAKNKHNLKKLRYTFNSDHHMAKKSIPQLFPDPESVKKISEMIATPAQST